MLDFTYEIVGFCFMANAIQESSGRDRILTQLLHASEGLSVADLQRELRLSRNAVYQHVNAMQRDGLVEQADIRPTRGRPTSRYRLSEAGKAQFPRHYALLASMLIEAVKSSQGNEALARVLEQLGRTLAEKYAGTLTTLPEAERLRAVAGILQELGYAAQTEEPRRRGDPVLRAHNCVFHDLAAEHPEVCRLDLALLGALLGRPIRHCECMLRGGRTCRFGFADEPEPAHA
jgi:predicted ArsR family transcriptional regulator